jgi:hypothetical protein
MESRSESGKKHVVGSRRELILQKGGTEMKTMVRNKTVIRPQPQEAAVPRSAVPVKIDIAPKVPTTPKQAAPEIPPNKGLCVTCNEATTCSYAKNATAPVLYCEMFDDSQPQSQEAVEKVQTSTSPSETTVPDSDLKGLCVNCDNRHTCTFPKPEEGVWHCEEYR